MLRKGEGCSENTRRTSSEDVLVLRFVKCPKTGQHQRSEKLQTAVDRLIKRVLVKRSYEADYERSKICNIYDS